ncbi:glycoside hydrolase family 5 protein [Flaviaesturariibacter flavus]|uniref:Glycoside hydrolase family 5 protein n=1 Tax=Flaviaesturariibacter flavus TaxID=2502780 RepID=A0A4R1B9K7_9BACT|nr:glycoside hydrolase family 5 protein [Flaviaesturariibacter flavus]TCJ13595.1 glycoside hydrolase family 5 protein [Flaviaesturariibacter flavus]
MGIEFKCVLKQKWVLLLMLLAVGLLVQAQPVRVHGALSVKGTQLVDGGMHPVVLRGMSFGWDMWHPRFYNEGAVGWLARDWSCSVVRAAMGIEPERGYRDNPEASKARVEAVIRGAIDAGIYVIVDWHSHNRNEAEAVAFFSEMAKKWGAYPNVIWELFNEPDHESWAEVKQYAQAVIAAIRAQDPDNVILVGSPHWDQDLHLAAADPIRSVRNLMYTMHFYAAVHKGWLRERCEEALRKGLAIFISECAGTEATGDGSFDLDEWNRYIEWAEARRISWVIWSVSDKVEFCSVLLKTAPSDGNWQEKDLSESGRLARAYLRRYNGKSAGDLLVAGELRPAGAAALRRLGGLELTAPAACFAIAFTGPECRVVTEVPAGQPNGYLQLAVDGRKVVRVPLRAGSDTVLIRGGAGGPHRAWVGTDPETGSLFIREVRGKALKPLITAQRAGLQKSPSGYK